MAAAQSCSSSSSFYYSLLKQTPIDLFECFTKLSIPVYRGPIQNGFQHSNGDFFNASFMALYFDICKLLESYKKLCDKR